jgi:hypothetical protein
LTSSVFDRFKVFVEKLLRLVLKRSQAKKTVSMDSPIPISFECSADFFVYLEPFPSYSPTKIGLGFLFDRLDTKGRHKPELTRPVDSRYYIGVVMCTP